MSSFCKTILYFFFIQWGCTSLAQPRSYSEKVKLLNDIASKIDDTIKVQKLQDLSNYYVLKEGELKADMDTSYYYVKQSEILSSKVNYSRGKWMSFILYSKIYREGGKLNLGRTILEKAFAIANKLDVNWLRGEYYRELAEYHDLSKEGINHRIIYLNKALLYFKNGGSIKQQADLLVFLGGHYNFNGENKEALNCFNEAKFLYQESEFEDTQNLYSQIARVSLKLGLYKEAVHYGLLSISLAEKSNFTFFLTIDYTTIGLAYYKMENYDLAIKYHQKALKGIQNKFNVENYSRSILLFNLINDFLGKGRVVEAKLFLENYNIISEFKEKNSDLYALICKVKIYDALKQPVVASRYANLLIISQKKYKNHLLKNLDLDINNALLEHFFTIKKYDLSRIYLNKNNEILKKFIDADFSNRNQLIEFKLDSASGNYLKAISSLKKYEKTKDSLFNEVKAYQIASLQIKYDSDKKDGSIQSLTSESLLQKVVIEKDRVTKLIISLVLILFLIIICLLFRRYKSKLRSNNKLLIKQNEIQNINISLKRFANEKELLLKEIHHRVKNNLQIVMSLLNSQSNFLTDSAATAAIRDSQHRIYSMSLIHQKLYQSEGITVINMSDYIKELVNYLNDSYENKSALSMKIDLINLDTSIAIPVGLIVNEVVTNIFKHAFPSGKKGKIEIKLTYHEFEILLLEIKDDGVGISKEIDLSNSKTLGISLIEGLSKEINGTLKITNCNGTKVTVLFSQFGRNLSAAD
ncbi:two-component sensor histidine kinase [Flavobacterium sp. 7E]|uniref:histidine kinase dimerization/phosphoacceptor domain -containing protein n=1 Tax=Flavobacterium sp. 7E TaxID=2735898 RepID=UPI00156EBAF1|nr:histidine kinase dimerization/phosphoacceptor domain -containing protein [Flavobacterium sp. 7E]NRS87797.1 two-component sensor histidine kinase [Flavobacterium sp. 7E]